MPQVRTSLAFYRGRVKVFETPVVERTMLDAADRHAAIFQFEVPAGELQAGPLHLPDQHRRRGGEQVRVPAPRDVRQISSAGLQACHRADLKVCATSASAVQAPGSAVQASGMAAQRHGTLAQLPGTSAQHRGTPAQVDGTSEQTAGTASDWRSAAIPEASARADSRILRLPALSVSPRTARMKVLSTVERERGDVARRTSDADAGLQILLHVRDVERRDRGAFVGARIRRSREPSSGRRSRRRADTIRFRRCEILHEREGRSLARKLRASSGFVGRRHQLRVRRLHRSAEAAVRRVLDLRAREHERRDRSLRCAPDRRRSAETDARSMS